MFCEIAFRLFISLYKRDRLATINLQLLLFYLIVLKTLYSLSLSFPVLGFFFLLRRWIRTSKTSLTIMNVSNYQKIFII